MANLNYTSAQINARLAKTDDIGNKSNLVTNTKTDLVSSINEIAADVYPLAVDIGTNNAGTYEVGTSVTPSIELSITRKGSAVIPTSVTPSSGTYDSETNIVTDSAISSGTKTINIVVVQGGQTKSVSVEYKFTNYRYKGALASKPDTSNIVAAIRALPKELSTVTRLGETTLQAGKYYLFAVKGTVDLIVMNAKSSGIIDIPASDKGTCIVPQENGVGDGNTYSWVIVPAASNTWYFQITNP